MGSLIFQEKWDERTILKKKSSMNWAALTHAPERCCGHGAGQTASGACTAEGSAIATHEKTVQFGTTKLSSFLAKR